MRFLYLWASVLTADSCAFPCHHSNTIFCTLPSLNSQNHTEVEAILRRSVIEHMKLIRRRTFYSEAIRLRLSNMSPVPPGCGHISKGSESLYQYFCFQKLPFIRLCFQQSAFRSHTHTAGAVADNCRCSRWAHSNVQITFKTVRQAFAFRHRILWQHVKHMYSNILCVQKQILHTRPLLCGCSVGRHSFSTLLPVPDVLLCYAEYAQVAEWRKGRKISRLFFFSLWNKCLAFQRAQLCCRPVC